MKLLLSTGSSRVLRHNSRLIIIAILFNPSCLMAQNKSGLQINADKSVTISYYNQTAEKVQLDATFLTPKVKINTPIAPINAKTKVSMTKDGQRWTYTSKPLPSNIYMYRFFADDTFDLDYNNHNVMRDVDEFYNFFIIPGTLGDIFADNPSSQGTITKVWYPSTMTHWSQRRMTIYTPPNYSSSKEHYPVLYLLHGSGGDEDSWTEIGRAKQILDNLIAQQAITPMIVVMPNGNVDLDCSPTTPGHITTPSSNNVSSMLGEMETTFIKDIVEYVDSHYRTLPDKSHRAIAGYSLGGLHTLFITLNNTSTFDYIGLFSAQTTNLLDSNNISPLADITNDIHSLISSFSFKDNNNTADNSQMTSFLDIYQREDNKLQQLSLTPPTLLYIAVGSDDFTLKLNDKLRAKLQQHNINYLYHPSSGGHTWDNWRQYLIYFLTQLFK